MVSSLIPRYDRSFGSDRVALVNIQALTDLPIGEHPRTTQKPQTNAHFVGDRNDAATNKLNKWPIELPPSLYGWRDKLHEVACPAKERDDT
jgi:hypothetical protein